MNANEPEIVKMTVYIPIELDTEIRVAAARRRTTMSAIAIEAFEAYVAAQLNPATSQPQPRNRRSTDREPTETVSAIAS